MKCLSIIYIEWHKLHKKFCLEIELSVNEILKIITRWQKRVCEEVRNAIARKNEAFKTFCKTGLEEHEISYRKTRNQTKKVIAKAMKTKAEKEMEELREKPSKIFKFVKFMKRDGKDVEGGNWMKGRDGRIGFSQEDRYKVWKEHMERIINGKNTWDHNVDTAMVEGPVESFLQESEKSDQENETGKGYRAL